MFVEKLDVTKTSNHFVLTAGNSRIDSWELQRWRLRNIPTRTNKTSHTNMDLVVMSK